MIYEISLRGQSYIDLEESFLWYSKREADLGNEFLKQIENCLSKIESSPHSYPIIYKNIRRALVKKFPFGIFYLIDKSKIIVLAIFHSSRDPKSLGERI